MKAQIEVITPTEAEALLSKNGINRKLSEKSVRNYSSMIRDGMWKLNGQPIIVSDKGNLLDGQHRLTAIVNVGQSVLTLVVRGVSEDVFDSIDNGRVRSAADVLSVLGCKYTIEIAAASRACLNYTSGVDVRHKQDRLRITEFFEEHEYLAEAVEMCSRLKGQAPVSAVASIIFLANESRKHDAQVAQFVEGLVSGENLSKGDPRLTLREWFILQRLKSRGRSGGNNYFTGVARAWNAWVNGNQLKTMRIGDVVSLTQDKLPIVGFNAANYPPVPTRNAKLRQTRAAAIRDQRVSL